MSVMPPGPPTPPLSTLAQVGLDGLRHASGRLGQAAADVQLRGPSPKPLVGLIEARHQASASITALRSEEEMTGLFLRVYR